MSIDVKTMADTQLTDLIAEVRAEQERRRAEPHVDSGRAELVADLRTSGTVTGPATATPETPTEDVPAWVNPGVDHLAMYLLGDVVSHNGKIWESSHRGLNHWEPGGTGIDYRIWADITPSDIPVDPSGPAEYVVGHDYSVGDLFTYEGVVYNVITAHTSAAHWPPSSSPSLYSPA